MAKSKISRPDGTLIEVSGTPEEIKKILELYSHVGIQKPLSESSVQKASKDRKQSAQTNEVEDTVIQIVQQIRNSDQSEKIETNILDQSSQVDRVLLPLYIAKKYIGDDIKMTSGSVYSVLQQLGVKMSLANISKTLGNTGSKYVIQHNKRHRGESTQYTLGLRGEKYIAALLE